jgi:chromosome segregation ATPase
MADKKKGPGASENASTMADKKKGVGADSGPPPKPSKVCKVFDSLNKICCIAKELKDDALGVDELERLLDNQKKLVEQLKAKDAQIADLTTEVESLKTAKSLLWEEFHEQYQELTAELDDLRDVKTDLEETRTKLKEAEEAASAAKNENKKLRLGAEKTAEHKRMADEQLKSTEEELENLRLRSTGVEFKYRELTGVVGDDQLQERNAIAL